MGRLAHKVALITGAGSGIGESTARLFAAEGAKVVLTDVNAAAVSDVAKAIGASAIATAHDVADADQWRAAVELATTSFGSLDILVNCAGVGVFKSLLDTDQASFDATVNINERGVFLGIKAAIPALTAARGVIVNLSSVAGLRGSPGTFSYATTKFAVLGITRSAAHDLAPMGIRVNAVLPGATDTPMFRATTIPGFCEAIAQATALKRVGLPIEVARAILFLASDDASYITGSELVVDGGLSA